MAVGVRVGVPVAVAVRTLVGLGIRVGVRVGVGVVVGTALLPQLAASNPSKASKQPAQRSIRNLLGRITQSLRSLPCLPAQAQCNIRPVAAHKAVKILPSILSADFACLGAQVAAAEAAGADAIHVDVMDGHFVPNITVGPLVVEALRRSCSLPLQVHLMITEPDRYAPEFIAAGASSILFHAEATATPYRLLSEIRRSGALAGVVLNPMTPAIQLDELVPHVDLVLLMTVEPGFGGQQFIPTMYAKIARVRAFLDERGRQELDLEVDGGVNLSTAPALVRAGANVLVAGAAIFQASSIAKAIAELRAAAELGLKQPTGRGA